MSVSTAVGIVRMPIGNLQSVYNSLWELGHDPRWVDETVDVEDLSHLILPGVGNFRAVSSALEARGLAAKARRFAASGRPLLGICVGMQLLATSGEEGGGSDGLGLIAGQVTRLPEDLPLPHVGWNTVRLRHTHPVFEGIKPGRDFYFVHSYAFVTSEEGDALATTDYGSAFVSAVARDNIVGVQFHPEKSQVNGLKLLDNFCGWDGRC